MHLMFRKFPLLTSIVFGDFDFGQIDLALEQGVEAVRSLVLNGFSSNVTRFNMGQKYKYHKI